jgi:hypothetical protein
MPTTTTPPPDKPAEIKQSPPVPRWRRTGLKLLLAAALAGLVLYQLKFSPVRVVSHLTAPTPSPKRDLSFDGKTSLICPLTR